MTGAVAAGSKRTQLQVHLDYQLCHTEHKSGQWRNVLGKNHFRAENITDLMELVYFLWFEARQLTRAAKMLYKVRCTVLFCGDNHIFCLVVLSLACTDLLPVV